MKTISDVFAIPIFALLCVIYIDSFKQEEQVATSTHTIVNEITKHTSWDGWSSYSDSSHTVTKSISLEVFPINVTFVFVKDLKAYFKTDFGNYYPSFGVPPDSAFYAVTMTRNNHPNDVVIVFPHSASKNNDVKSHEVTHAVDQAMDKLGLVGTECRAYLVGYLMKELDEVPEWKRPTLILSTRFAPIKPQE